METLNDDITEILSDFDITLNKIRSCDLKIKKEGGRRNPAFAHETDVGLDMYPTSVTLEAFSGKSYEIDLNTDCENVLESIINAENEEKRNMNIFKRFINFFKGNETRCGWKRLKFNTGIAVEPDIRYFVIGVPNSRVVKTDVVLQNSVGIIDPTYRGTIRFMYRNLESGFIRDTVVTLCDCCGQIIPLLRVKPIVNYTSELSETERGSGGFGSSAK